MKASHTRPDGPADPGPSAETGFGSAELAHQEPDAIRHLKESVRSGKEWHIALLEAVGMWTLPEEELDGRKYRYLLQGEAFDWLLLSERLCQELDGMVPMEQKEQLLFHGLMPQSISARELQNLIGYNKHRALLNYWYGVVVEEALQLAVEEEVRKQHRAKCLPDSEELVEQAFVRLYNDNRSDLLREFFPGKGNSKRVTVSLTEMKEFTYWLFKRRLKVWDPARVASDTRKALEKLDSLRPSDSALIA